MKLQGIQKTLIVKKLQFAKDKFSIFANADTLNKCNFSESELVSLIDEFLSDEQKAKLFGLEHFKKLPSYLKTQIIEKILDSNIKAKLLADYELISSLENHEVEEIARSLDDENKIKILNNSQFLQRLETPYRMRIAKSLSEEKKREILSNKEFVRNTLELDEHQIAFIVASLESETVKKEMIESYNFKEMETADIVRTFSDEGKLEVLLENKYKLGKYYLEVIASTLRIDTLVDFFRENKEFFEKNSIAPYNIIIRLGKEEQLEFLSNLENAGLSLGEKRQILATLKRETKKELDLSNFPKEYQTAIKYVAGKVKVDLNEDFETYSDLGNLCAINPMTVANEDKEKLKKLLEVCPQIALIDNLGLGESTVEEYKEAEAWIEKVLQGIDSSWTNIQKIAYIDNAIGKKISYSPDYHTEVSNIENARALWKVICSGYGVCNGIAQIEQYILAKIGIEAKLAESDNHTFLRLKNIEIPNEDGSISIGDTLIDPTWNLAEHRYGAMPSNFCKSYEEIRKNDKDDDKNDTESHKNDKDLSDVTLNLDEKSLREIFASIGVAGKDGSFPIIKFIEMSDILYSLNISEESALEKQFSLLAAYYPQFATCNNSTLKILRAITLNHKNLKFNKCVASRVYERKDQNKRPVIYVYIDLPKAGKKFYFADKETGNFLGLSQTEFEERFECYEMDMKKENGHRPWEEIGNVNNIEDVVQSFDRIVASEGEEK